MRTKTQKLHVSSDLIGKNKIEKNLCFLEKRIKISANSAKEKIYQSSVSVVIFFLLLKMTTPIEHKRQVQMNGMRRNYEYIKSPQFREASKATLLIRKSMAEKNYAEFQKKTWFFSGKNAISQV